MRRTCKADVFVPIKGLGLVGRGDFIRNTPVPLDKIELYPGGGAYLHDEKTNLWMPVNELDCD